MNKILSISVLSLIIITTSGFSFRKTDYRKGMKTNVCKELKGKVLIYTIFVDTKTTSPWTEYDIKTTLDSIRVAVHWLSKQSKNNNVNIQFSTDYYVGPEFTTIKKNLPEESIFLSVTEPNKKQGFANINKWSDYIARKAGSNFHIEEKEGVREVKKPKNKERLIAHLRDTYDVESVVLLYMMNNYFRNDISVPMNTLHTKDIEYAIVSYKYPAEIAHNILHLFGAVDLYETIYRKSSKSIEFAAAHFPNDIMQDPYGKHINSLEISDYTKYLIGWNNALKEEYQFLLFDRAKI